MGCSSENPIDVGPLRLLREDAAVVDRHSAGNPDWTATNFFKGLRLQVGTNGAIPLFFRAELRLENHWLTAQHLTTLFARKTLIAYH